MPSANASNPTMPVSQQVLQAIAVKKLKNIANLDELKFDGSPLIAIMGVNGCGKSTILHALACAFAPEPGSTRHNYRFPNFFLPTSDSKWQGSEFSLVHSFRDGQDEQTGQIAVYRKQEDRWAPRYDRRPQRHVEFIGVRSCVPRIEEEKATTFLDLQTNDKSDAASAKVLEDAGYVLNRNYTSLSEKKHWTGRTYRGATHGGVSYSALSMGAGEQRIFNLLSVVTTVPKYALVLVDEIDLLLHEDALYRLVNRLHARATERKLQIVFTTHRESVMGLEDKVVVNHMFSAGEKTLVVRGTTPDAIHRLTGKQVRPYEAVVEDDLSGAIVARVAEMRGSRKLLTITPVGAAANVITVLGGFALRTWDLSKAAFVLDGDVLRTPGEREDAIARVITGTEPDRPAMRTAALGKLRAYRVGAGVSPEQALHAMVRDLPDSADPEVQEIVACARGIVAVANKHDFVDAVIERLGHERQVGLSKLLQVASQSPDWAEFVREITDWFEAVGN